MAGKYSLNRRLVLLVLPFLVVMFLLDALSMYNTSLTWDEWDHVDFGKSVLERNISGASMQKMPVTVLNYLPYRLTDALGLAPPAKTAVFLSRLPSVLISLVLALFVFFWSYRLYGTRGALISLTLYAFCPNIIAHSRLATTDIYCACFMFMALFVFVNYLRKPRPSSFALSAITLGVAQIAKSTALLLFPLYVLLWLIKVAVLKGQSGAALPTPHKPAVLRRLIATAVFLCIVALTVNAAYLFQGSMRPVGEYLRESRSESAGAMVGPTEGKLVSRASHFSAVPVPLPKAFVQAFLLGIRYNATGEGHAPIYLLGKVSQKGWWYYFPVAFGLKTPLALFALLLIAVFVAGPYIKQNPVDEIAIICAVILIFGFFTFLCTAQIGVRYLLPIYPLLYVFVGKAASFTPRRRAASFRAVLLGLCLWFCASSLSFYPHYIAYFNELIGDRTNMYKYLADSNVDWRQDAYYLQDYLDKHNNETISVNPHLPVSGKVIMSVNALAAGDGSTETGRWLKDNFRPIGHIGYSMLIYDISADELSSKLAK
jgi:hypothetical protein